MNMAERLKIAREAKGLTQAKLAELVGVSQPTITAWESPGGHKMRRDNRIRLATVLDVDPAWIEYGSGRGPEGTPSAASGASVAPRPPEAMQARHFELPLPNTMSQDLPVYGVAAGNGNAEDGDFAFEPGYVIEYVRRPPGLVSMRDAYALYVTGDSMEPKYEHGELVLVAPNKPVRVGDYVIVCIKARAPGEPERCFIKRLVRRHPDQIEVRQYNPAKSMRFPTSMVARIHRVLTMADAFGMA